MKQVHTETGSTKRSGNPQFGPIPLLNRCDVGEMYMMEVAGATKISSATENSENRGTDQ
jgi:hypothetical protein